MENKSLKIKDESNDKSYFTIIPNYIVNHSTANDQALYLQMKKVAGENGICFLSKKTIKNKLKIGRTALQKSIDYLVEKKWITFAGKKARLTMGGKQKVDSYIVNDIWQLNIEHYSKNKGGAETTPLDVGKGGLEQQQGGAETTPKKNPCNNNNKEEVETSNEVSILRNYFLEVCDREKGYRPELSWAKDSKLLKDRLAKYPLAKLKTLIDDFFDSNVGDNLGYSLSLCLSASVVNQWLAGKLKRVKIPFYFNNKMKKVNGKWFVLEEGELKEFADDERLIKWK